MSPRDGRLRFDPPPLRPDPDLAWVLARAFAPAAAPVPPPPEPDRALALARDLDVAARIASRIDRRDLARDLGPGAAEAALEQRRLVAAWSLRVLRTAGEVASVAADTGIPLAFLKGAALHLAGHVAVAGRSASDVDVLVAASRAQGLHRALRARGYQPRGTNRSAHHLAPLGRANDPWVEVHSEVPGCRLPGSAGPLSLEALDGSGLLRPAPGLPATARVPAVAVLAAHALVHGIDDHGFGADVYPPLRMACDLADLLGPGVTNAPPAAAVLAHVGDAVSAQESRAALSLVARLCEADPSLPGDPTPAGRLLAHLVSGALDPDYRDALRLRQALHLLRTGGLRVLRDKSSHRLQELGPLAARVPAALRLAARLLRADARVRWRSRGFVR